VNENDVSAAVTMWRGHGAAELPWSDIERALRQLPESGICAVSDDAAALLMLSPADTLFTVSADDGNVRVTSRPLAADRLTVSLEWADGGSRWTFRHTGDPDSGEPWQAISGSVAIDPGTCHEYPDDREQFARALADRAGWTLAARQASARGPQGVEEDEPRWRERTDLWGRPLDVRRH
jgi:hypothetical protein